MKHLRIVLLALVAVGLILSIAYARGNAEKGKALFDAPTFAGGTTACNSAACHPDGRGLENAGKRGRKEWTNPGGTWLNLEDACNVCIILANKGKAINPKGKEMKDLVAYVKSFSRHHWKKK